MKLPSNTVFVNRKNVYLYLHITCAKTASFFRSECEPYATHISLCLNASFCRCKSFISNHQNLKVADWNKTCAVKCVVVCYISMHTLAVNKGVKHTWIIKLRLMILLRVIWINSYWCMVMKAMEKAHRFWVFYGETSNQVHVTHKEYKSAIVWHFCVVCQYNKTINQ